MASWFRRRGAGCRVSHDLAPLPGAPGDEPGVRPEGTQEQEASRQKDREQAALQGPQAEGPPGPALLSPTPGPGAWQSTCPLSPLADTCPDRACCPFAHPGPRVLIWSLPMFLSFFCFSCFFLYFGPFDSLPPFLESSHRFLFRVFAHPAAEARRGPGVGGGWGRTPNLRLEVASSVAVKAALLESTLGLS